MISSKTKAYVTQADDDFIGVRVLNADVSKQLEGLGFTFSCAKNEFRKNILNDDEKAAVLVQLRDMGFAFSDGREWCPSEVFQYFRDRGLVSGSFIRISWYDPDSYQVSTV